MPCSDPSGFYADLILKEIQENKRETLLYKQLFAQASYRGILICCTTSMSTGDKFCSNWLLLLLRRG
jgi:hypothetical protein